MGRHSESISQDVGKTLEDGFSIVGLTPAFLGGHHEDSFLVDAIAERLKNQAAFILRETRRMENIEKKGDPGTHLVHVLPSRSAAS